MNDTVTLDRYILDTLMADLVEHDRRPSAFLVLLAIWTAGEGDRVALSYQDLAWKTGLSKRAAQMAVAHLSARGLIEVTKTGPTDPPRYQPTTPWRRWKK
jgi:DNA-binding MarR family transcriptional regulator